MVDFRVLGVECGVRRAAGFLVCEILWNDEKL